MFIVNTFLGFLIVQLTDILTRDKASKSSPQKFSFTFFWKDNALKIAISLLLSFSLSAVTFINFNAAIILSGIGEYEGLIYVLIGAVPEFVVQKLKEKLGIQPPVVQAKGESYNRIKTPHNND